MAPLAYRIVEHGVYCMPFFVNPNYAQKSGCTAEDIELLKLLIPHAYELNRSAIRPTSASATHGIWSIRACLAAARIISCWKR